MGKAQAASSTKTVSYQFRFERAVRRFQSEWMMENSMAASSSISAGGKGGEKGEEGYAFPAYPTRQEMEEAIFFSAICFFLFWF